MTAVSDLPPAPPLSYELDPLADIPIADWLAALPKADLHLHADADGHVDRVLAPRTGRAPCDWRAWARRMLEDIPPGIARLRHWGSTHCFSNDELEVLDADDEIFIARVLDILEPAAIDGAILVEIRFGATTIRRRDFLVLFREAEQRVRDRFPQFVAEPILSGLAPSRVDRWETVLPLSIQAARQGLAGLDIIPDPYDTEADWSGVARWTEELAAAGLGITVHAGEFSTANVEAALGLPGVRRLGHAVFAAREPRLLEALAQSGVTVECCLSCNVLLGGVGIYAEHPFQDFVANGIPVTLNSDDPLRVCTTIAREYAIAAALGCSRAELLSFTRNAIQASFTSASRRSALLDELNRHIQSERGT
jgi:adenosine deaminase